MIKLDSVKRYIRQIFALTEKNIFLEMRFKAHLVSRFLNPIIQLFVLIFVFGLIFNIKEGYSIGYWNSKNYILFLLIAFSIQFSKSIINRYKVLFIREKYWKTLSATMVAPVNRFTLLFGTLVSEMLMNSIPLIIIFIIAYILYPISLFYLFLMLLIYFFIYLIFGALGLLIGVFAISHESLVPYLQIFFRILFLFSCINYPVQIFPELFQFFVYLNPFYYLFDLIRLVWYLGYDYEAAIRLITPTHIISTLLLTILLPIFSIFLFNKVYKKYGITGY